MQSGVRLQTITHEMQSGSEAIAFRPGSHELSILRRDNTFHVLDGICPGDLDGDRTVGADDLAGILSRFGSTCP